MTPNLSVQFSVKGHLNEAKTDILIDTVENINTFVKCHGMVELKLIDAMIS